MQNYLLFFPFFCVCIDEKETSVGMFYYFFRAEKKDTMWVDWKRGSLEVFVLSDLFFSCINRGELSSGDAPFISFLGE